jgi:hypothetical protein
MVQSDKKHVRRDYRRRSTDERGAVCGDGGQGGMTPTTLPACLCMQPDTADANRLKGAKFVEAVRALL